jgi:hypothetical protein
MDQPDLNETSRLQQLYERRVAARDTGNRAGCQPVEAILAVIQREGSEDERLAALDHVMACPDCHREYEWLTAVEEAATTAAPRARDVAARRWWQRGAPLALAASVLLAVGVLLIPKLNRRGPEPVRGPESDIVPVGPTTGAQVKLPFTLAWHPLNGATRYVLEIQTSDGTVAFADTTGDTTVTVGDASHLAAGSDYRWWVREVTDGAAPRSSPFSNLRLTPP